MAKALEQVAKEVGAKHITAGASRPTPFLILAQRSPSVTVAIAYVMQKAPYVFPIIGGRKIEHLISNIEALSISLSNEHIKFIESVLPFDFGFPYQYFVSRRFFKSSAHSILTLMCLAH